MPGGGLGGSGERGLGGTGEKGGLGGGGEGKGFGGGGGRGGWVAVARAACWGAVSCKKPKKGHWCQ